MSARNGVRFRRRELISRDPMGTRDRGAVAEGHRDNRDK